MNVKVNKRLVKKISAMGLMFVLAGTMSGCMEHELAVQENYSTIRQNDYRNAISNGVENVLDVAGEEFKLVTQYKCSDNVWLITSDKELYMTVATRGLPEGYTVYIDNIHIDTFILSDLAVFNGIKQDTMDDRIHNSMMMGFPISDTVKYVGINNIEGMNQEFIEGTVHGYSGYTSGAVTTKRYLESNYRDWGVYGNKITVVYDLLVKGPNDRDFRNVSVIDKIVVEASPYEKETATQEDAKIRRLEQGR